MSNIYNVLKLNPEFFLKPPLPPITAASSFHMIIKSTKNNANRRQCAQLSHTFSSANASLAFPY